MALRASDHWTSFDSIEPDSEHSRKISHVLTAGNFSFLSDKALQLRREIIKSEGDTEPPTELTCHIDPARFTSGYYNVVFEINFSDSSQWIARVRLPDQSADDAEVANSMRSEIATTKYVGAHTNIPIPQIYGHDVDDPNPFGFRYILLQSLPGRVLETRFSRSVPRPHWPQLAAQLADYYHQLSRLRFDRIGRISGESEPTDKVKPRIVPLSGMRTYNTSLAYFHALRQCQSESIRAAHPVDEQWATAAWILEMAVPAMVAPEHVHGPFPLAHMDLHYNNILVDKDFRITGIIDWSDAQTVPLERFVITPEFAHFPGLSVEGNEPTVSFREMFAKALRAREQGGGMLGDGDGDGDGSGPLLSDLLGTPLWEVVYRCTYSYHWRALTDARLVLRQTFGPGAKWEDFLAFYKAAPVNHQVRSS